jgi:hypothetical protein
MQHTRNFTIFFSFLTQKTAENVQNKNADSTPRSQYPWDRVLMSIREGGRRDITRLILTQRDCDTSDMQIRVIHVPQKIYIPESKQNTIWLLLLSSAPV